MKNLRKVMALVIALCMTLSMLGTITFANETDVAIPDPIFTLDLSEYDGKWKAAKMNTTAKNGVEGTDITVDVWRAVNGAAQDGSALKKTIDAKNGTSTDYVELKSFRPTETVGSGWRGYTKNYILVSGEDLLVPNATVEFWVKVDNIQTRPHPNTGADNYTKGVGAYFANFGPIDKDADGDGTYSFNEFNASTAKSQLFNYQGLNMYGKWSSNSTYYTYGNWAHVVMLREAAVAEGEVDQNTATTSMYINGVKVAASDSTYSQTLTDTSGKTWDAGAFIFGMPLNYINTDSSTDARDVPPQKSISGLKIYDEILTEEQVTKLYNDTKDSYNNDMTATLSIADGTKMTAGAKSLKVTYNCALSEEDKAKVVLSQKGNSEFAPDYTWAEDNTAVTISFTAEKKAEYTLTYPQGARLLTANYTVAENIDENKIFDLEFDAKTNTATDIVNNIPVTVQRAGNTDYSVMSTDTIYGSDGSITDYIKTENKLTGKRSEAEVVAHTDAYSGIWAESDKLTGDEITIELWAKVGNDTGLDGWATTFFGLAPMDASGNRLSGREISLSTQGKQTATSSTRIKVNGAANAAASGVSSLSNYDISGLENKGTGLNWYKNQWSQIVMTRKLNSDTNTYSIYLYINSPDGNYKSIELKSNSVASLAAEATGRLTVSMPCNGMTSTTTTNMSVDNMEIGDVRVYNAIMSEEDALAIYNRDKDKFVPTTDDFTFIDTKLFDGETEVDSVNGVENVKLTGKVISRVENDAKLVAGLYDNGGKVLVAAKTVDIIAGEITPLDITFENEAVEDGFIKLFVWDGFGGLRPYTLGDIIGVAAD